MHGTEIFFVACGLAMDAFAVAIGASASGQAKGKRAAFRLSFHFGLFQFGMPVIGWAVASRLQSILASVDHWIAFGLLLIVGGHMMYAAVKKNEEGYRTDPSRGFSLVALSLATSIDALAVGFSLGMLGVEILWPSLIIGLVTAALSLTGVAMGSTLGRRFGRPVEVLGGFLLTLIGLNIVVSHLFL